MKSALVSSVCWHEVYVGMLCLLAYWYDVYISKKYMWYKVFVGMKCALV